MAIEVITVLMRTENTQVSIYFDMQGIADPMADQITKTN